MTVAFKHTELFGGAITANIPTDFADVSKLRQVPDNQEVYLDKNAFTSLTFDITERVSHLSTDKEALEWHFADIVDETDTQSIQSIVENVELPNFPSTTPIIVLRAITKPHVSAVTMNALTPTHTDLHLTLFRLVEQNTDIVVTLNIPHFLSELEGQTSTSTTQEETEQAFKSTYHQILTSFTIKDWHLFSDE